MAEFNYSNYVADMAQRKGPMHEEAEVNPASDVFLNQSQSTDKLVSEEDLKEYEVIYVERNGKCYRKDDEGNMDEVNMYYCRMYAESVKEDDSQDDDLGIFNDIEEDLLNGDMEDEDKIEYLRSIMDFCKKKIKEVYAEGGLEEAIDDTDVEASEDEFNSAEFDKEPSKKDIKAAEKEFSFSVPKADASNDSAFEKAKQIIKIKVGKILAQPKGQRSKSTDLAVLKQFIQKPEIKKAFKSRGLDVMDFVKDVIA